VKEVTPSKTYRHTAIVEFTSRDSIAPTHIEDFLVAAVTTEVPRYYPFDPLGRVDRRSVRVLSIAQEPENETLPEVCRKVRPG
jgi:hypothetical protein